MVSLGIATGFERQYGVLKRLGSTPLGRPALLAAKTLAILAVEVLLAHPGQLAALRADPALAPAGWDELVKPAVDDPVDGVLHVVANGHATPRGTMPADATREDLLAAELEDFAITSHRIASMAVRRDKPIWLVIAVTKADLYPDEVDEAVHYYSPGSGSPFGEKVDALRALALELIAMADAEEQD